MKIHICKYKKNGCNMLRDSTFILSQTIFEGTGYVHNQLREDVAHCLTSVGQLGYFCKAFMI